MPLLWGSHIVNFKRHLPNEYKYELWSKSTWVGPNICLAQVSLLNIKYFCLIVDEIKYGEASFNLLWSLCWSILPRTMSRADQVLNLLLEKSKADIGAEWIYCLKDLLTNTSGKGAFYSFHEAGFLLFQIRFYCYFANLSKQLQILNWSLWLITTFCHQSCLCNRMNTTLFFLLENVLDLVTLFWPFRGSPSITCNWGLHSLY